MTSIQPVGGGQLVGGMGEAVTVSVGDGMDEAGLAASLGAGGEADSVSFVSVGGGWGT